LEQVHYVTTTQGEPRRLGLLQRLDVGRRVVAAVEPVDLPLDEPPTDALHMLLEGLLGAEPSGGVVPIRLEDAPYGLGQLFGLLLTHEQPGSRDVPGRQGVADRGGGKQSHSPPRR